jgi:hypothetical protein
MPTITAYVHAYVPTHNAGAETTLHDILRHLVSVGYDANVVIKPGKYDIASGKTLGETEEYCIDGVHVIPGIDKRTLLHYVPRSDITISHLECSRRTHILSNDYSIPSIHLVHNTHPLTVHWMASADGLIINTDWISNEPDFVAWNGPKMVLNPPVNSSQYKTGHGKSVTLVNLWEDKGSKVFYELARRMPDVSFIGLKGGYGEQVIEELPNVKIIEHTPDIKSVYSQTKVLLMPSKHESFGRVGVEAMASGIPVIAEPTPGLKESLGDAGTFVDRDDLDAWETALRATLKPAKYGKLSKLALAQSESLEARRRVQLQTLEMFVSELIRTKKVR